MRAGEIERLTGLLKTEHSLWEKGFEAVAGVDEVGRGPLAGPVVAAAVVFTKKSVTDLARFSGVNDSKKVSPEKRTKLSEIIRSEAACYSFGIVDEKKIDEINILRASLLAMELAVKSLKIKPHYLLIDGPYTLGIEGCGQLAVVGGDARCFAVAAASIVAKVARDAMMLELDKQYPLYGFAEHKGYGTKKHIEAIKKHGRSPVHRKCFGKDF
jgi:ribonuclease HII